MELKASSGSINNYEFHLRGCGNLKHRMLAQVSNVFNCFIFFSEKKFSGVHSIDK